MTLWCRRAALARYQKYARDQAVPAADAILCVTVSVTLVAGALWGLLALVALVF